MAERDYNVWLGRRIREIMAEKKVKARGFAKAIDLGRMTLERNLDGRYATAEELEKISGGLGITVERLKRTDVAKRRRTAGAALLPHRQGVAAG
ncbi:Cro/C1-type helix-turn-helix DNA-binding protein [Tumebacillus sp. BK434]|uniref:helix-turn-helix domain-containing protein n=1 Tax=Tumebacillus sp. BK434 TaxID=2512169 RepID=UPI0010CE4E92|nr:helix-turn-helix domain-containing protein [Tumebacillus sp. BK434]TCP59498.1 Cro/C1-type helix-turn-helix DNA-binding protein [Tumebacillus sp. BK434]